MNWWKWQRNNCAFSVKGKNIQLDNETCHAIQRVIEERNCDDNFA